jgi:uncharacterized protein
MRKRSNSNSNNGIVLLIIFAVLLIGTVDIQKDFLTDETVQFSGERSVVVYLPAVDSDGNGVLATLALEAYAGTGKELINIDKLVFWEDTQQSIRTAKGVAEQVTGKSADELDLVYSITAQDAAVVGGPSAGAGLTIATIAILEGREIDNHVIMTGSVDEFGNIGPVGGILEKAIAASEVADLFLIPKGEAITTYLEPKRECAEKSNYIYCEVTYEATESTLGEEVGVDVKEVATIEEAIGYFWDETT